MVMILCKRHTTELIDGFREHNLSQFIANSARLDELVKRYEQGKGLKISAENFEPIFMSSQMIADALENYYGLPGNYIIQQRNECPMCHIIELGNPDAVAECVAECEQLAIKLGLLKTN